jgi:uncharacterized protein YhfF
MIGAAVALMLAASAPAAPDDAAVDAFLRRAGAATGAPVRIDMARTMGRNQDISRKITEQVLAGEKRATLAREAEFVEKGWPLPRPGQIVLVYDFDGKPSFIYRVVAAQVLPLGSVAPWHLMTESPALRDLSAWRKAHLGLWKDAIAGMSPDAVERMPVVWTRFEPVYPAASTPR